MAQKLYYICIDKSANCRIIVSTLQIVHIQLCIIVVAAVAQGVDLGHIAGCGEDIAVGVILIAGNSFTIFIHQIHYIALQVGDVIVGGAIILQRIRVTVGIIREIQEVAAVAFPQQLAAGIEIIVGSAAADGFLGAQAVGVVLKGKRSACAACGGKLAAIFPGKGIAGAVVVTQRITGCIVINFLAIKCRQQIPPIGISVSICVAIGAWESTVCPR